MIAPRGSERRPASVEASTGEGLYLLTERGFEPVRASAAESGEDGLRSLLRQELLGERAEPEAPRVQELLDLIGCAWEPASEPGHMRFAPPAAFMLDRVRQRARVLIEQSLAHETPLYSIEGVRVVDLSAPMLERYQSLVNATPGLYGTRPYEVDSDEGAIILRQTACIQKYSMVRDWMARGMRLPVALFEVSDSFRREPVDVLQRCVRLRQFRVAETHVHDQSLSRLLEITLAMNEVVTREMRMLSLRVVLFLTVTAEFLARHDNYLRSLTRGLDGPALVKVCEPGTICQDGVELDAEYKFVDAAGCTRELSTFQIDKRITSAMLDTADIPVWTIHAVLTGSLERYLFAVLNSVAIAEHHGIPLPFPTWIAPVATRVLVDNSDRDQFGASIASVLAQAGIPTELDDRSISLDAKIADADRLLVPVSIPLDARTSLESIVVRRHRHYTAGRSSVNALVAELEANAASFLTPSPRVDRLSTVSPFGWS